MEYELLIIWCVRTFAILVLLYSIARFRGHFDDLTRCKKDSKKIVLFLICSVVFFLLSFITTPYATTNLLAGLSNAVDLKIVPIWTVRLLLIVCLISLGNILIAPRWWKIDSLYLFFCIFFAVGFLLLVASFYTDTIWVWCVRYILIRLFFFSCGLMFRYMRSEPGDRVSSFGSIVFCLVISVVLLIVTFFVDISCF